VLGFVGRRLLVESVALVFGARQPGHELDGLPELEVTGLPVSDARALLDSVTPSRLDRRIRDRIVVETRGNPEVDAMINALGDVGGGLASTSLVVADECCPGGVAHRPQASGCPDGSNCWTPPQRLLLYVNW
jgi:hypothetical protein